MTAKAVVYVEDSSRAGIWPSHLDPIRSICQAYGATELNYIDKHVDGYFQEYLTGPVIQKRYATFAAWQADNGVGTIIGLEDSDTITANNKTGTNIVNYTHPTDATYLIGASNGFDPEAWDAVNDWVYLPQGDTVGLEGRDVLALVLGHRYFQSLG